MLRSFLPLLTLNCLLLFSCEPPEEKPLSDLEQLANHLPLSPGTNVIVVSFDALRADALGLYGFPQPTSPRLDAFAAECTVFDHAYTAAPVTPPSFASAFTGLLPNRVFHDWDLVWRDTLAQRFSDAGYATAAFLNNLQLSVERNFHTGFSTFEVYQSTPDEQVIADSLAWLHEHQQEKIFAWIHFLSPHAPYDRRELASHLYDKDYEGKFKNTSKGTFTTNDPKEIRRLRTLYDGEVLYADTLFGDLLDGLRELGYLENSIVLVTSDHGEEFMEHGGFQHDRLTEEHVQIPLLLYHPAIRTPLRSPVLVSNLDYFPTLLGLAGIESNTVLDGKDLRRLVAAPERMVGVSMTGSQKRWLSLRKGSLKVILTCMPGRSAVLYDLLQDPLELNDLSGGRKADLRTLLSELDLILGGDACEVMQAAVRGAGPAHGLSQENIDALKALGYLGAE
jgi:arylsulfatase